jgi:hypothetical protein
MSEFKYTVGSKVRPVSFETESTVVERQLLITGEPAYRLDPHPPGFGDHVPESALVLVEAAAAEGEEGAQSGDQAGDGTSPQGEGQGEGEQQPT